MICCLASVCALHDIATDKFNFHSTFDEWFFLFERLSQTMGNFEGFLFSDILKRLFSLKMYSQDLLFFNHNNKVTCLLIT